MLACPVSQSSNRRCPVPTPKDSIQHFENARQDRFREGLCLWLHQAETSRSGACYLLGFSVEIGMKAAYFRVLGRGLADDIDKSDLLAVKTRHPTLIKDESFHSLMFWAYALDDLRVQQGRPFVPGLSLELGRRSQAAYNRWRVGLRYRTDTTSPADLETLVETASWFDRIYTTLHT